MNFEDKFQTLPAQEQKLVVNNTWVSGLLLGAAAVIFAVLFLIASGQDILAALGPGGFLPFFADNLLPDNLMESGWWGFVVGPCILMATYCCLEYELRHKLKSYEADVTELRQGVTGELIAMPRQKILPAMFFTNFFEEALFRGTVIPITLATLAFVGLTGTPAALIASAVSALTFWWVHAQYRNKYSVITVLTLGMILAWIFLWWNSILVCFFAHFLYNLYQLSRERRLAVELDDYYGGKQPLSVLGDLLKK